MKMSTASALKSMVILGLSLYSTFIIGQTNYYVSLTGDDSNTGTSIGQAWQTIQYSMDNATANSIVNITAGTYNEKVEVNVSGTAGNQIVFRNNGSDVVTISGAGISGLDAIIGVFDQSYITIQGLIIKDNEQLDAQGIIVEGNCQNIEIRNNEISNINFSSDPNATANSSRNSQPLIVYGSNGSTSISNLIIDGNVVHDSRTGYSEGLAVNGNVDGFEVTNNLVHDIANIGIDLIGHENTAPSNDQARNGLVKGNTVYNCKSPYATAAGIYVDGAKDIVIENNIVYQNQWGIEIGCENVGTTTSGIIVRNNIVYNNDDSGLTIGGFDYPSGSGKVVDCYISNNTFYNNDMSTGGVGGVTGETNISYTENCTIENNVFYATNSSSLVLYAENVGTVALDYNLYFIEGTPEFEYGGSTYTSLSAFQSGSAQDANSLFNDPEFENPSSADFDLMALSPAIDAGNPSFTSASGETDYGGGSRVINERVDIGAYESSVALAIEYISSFKAIAYIDYIELQWVVAVEQKNDHYEVQRLSAGQEWMTIMSIEDKGAHRFKVRDSTPIVGLSYYRLKQIDGDGYVEYTDVVVVKWEAIGELMAYPNPVTNQLIIEFDNPINEKVSLEIFDVRGLLVIQKIDVEGNQVIVNVESFVQGIYFARVHLSKASKRDVSFVVVR